MRRFALVLAPLVLIAVSTPLIAQTETDEIEITRSVIKTERKAIVAANMQLNEAESRAFWPVYNEYVENLRKINDRKVRLITDYANAYENLTETQAKAFLRESVNIDKARLELIEDYIDKFEDVLASKKVARFFQIENKIDAIIEYSLAEEIPLVR
jgi:uncharacterized protein YutD